MRRFSINDYDGNYLNMFGASHINYSSEKVSDNSCVEEFKVVEEFEQQENGPIAEESKNVCEVHSEATCVMDGSDHKERSASRSEGESDGNDSMIVPLEHNRSVVDDEPFEEQKVVQPEEEVFVPHIELSVDLYYQGEQSVDGLVFIIGGDLFEFGLALTESE